MMEIAETMEITYPTTAIVLNIWNQLGWKSGVLLIFALGVLRHKRISYSLYIWCSTLY